MDGVLDHFPRFPRLSAILSQWLAAAWTTILRFLGAALPFQMVGCVNKQPRFPLTDEQRSARKEEFIRGLSRPAIRRLASRHNGGRSCDIFHSDAGSFNACFFVEFADDGPRWVVRIPIEPAVHDGWDKIQREAATMGYIRANTTIPTPRIHHFGRSKDLHRDPSKLLPYLIHEYLPGRSLDVQSLSKDTRERRDYFYSQLIDVLAQMRRLELPSAGSLMPDPSSGPDPILGPLSSIPINDLQIEGSGSVAPSKTLASAADFILYQFAIIQNTYKQPVSEHSLWDIQLELFALKHLETELHGLIRTLAPWDDGPFILTHLDLRWSNIIVDDDLNIQALIDWEWAGSIPRHLFMPPSWIAGRPPQYVTGEEYRKEFTQFHRVLVAKSDASEAHGQLAQEWDLGLLDRPELPIAALLQNHGQLLTIFYRTLYPKLFEAPRDEEVPGHFERSANSRLAAEAQRRFESSQCYTQYLKDNGLFEPDKETEAIRKLEDKLKEIREKRVLEQRPPSHSAK